MDRQIIAIVVQEGAKFLSELVRNYHPKKAKEAVAPTIKSAVKETEVEEKQATDVKTGCVPCSLGHLGTCSGLLNEAMRFAKADGLASDEVVNRINMCLDELNALERVDLRPQMIAKLPPEEKELADKALAKSRGIRHKLEDITSIKALEEVSSETQEIRNEIGKSWFKYRLSRMSDEEKKKVIEETLRKLEVETSKGEKSE